VGQEGIIVRRKVRSNFTTLDNNLIRDDRLSWKALGILTYLLSLPPDFKLYLKMLGNLRPSGRDSTRTGLNELQECGYLRIEKIRDDESGRFLGNLWEVTDTPKVYENQSMSPETDFPNTGFPTPDFPASENPPLVSNSSNKELTLQNTTTRGHPNPARLNLSEIETQAISNLLEGIEPDEQSKLLDELEGAMRCKSIKTTQVQWFRGVVRKYKKKSFTPSAGLKVAADRSRKRNEGVTARTRPIQRSSPDFINQLKSDLEDKTGWGIDGSNYKPLVG
jgi:hypothetical protein